MNKLIILDRDGVINADSKDFIKSPAEWQPIAGSLAAIAGLTALDFQVVVATNQSGLARGLFNEAMLAQIHQKMHDAVLQAGGKIDQIFYCPHGPQHSCACRKPKPGLFLNIAKAYQMDLSGVYAVGDSLRDIHAAQAAGATPILVLTGNGKKTLTQLAEEPQQVSYYDNLNTFVKTLKK